MNADEADARCDHENNKRREREMERDPFRKPENEGRQGRGSFFVDHSCYRCKDGLQPCVTKTGHCEYPHARND